MKVVPINETNGKLDDFGLFCSCYPRKVARLDALKAWGQTSKLRPGIEELIGAVNRMAQLSTDKEFIPYPATWLRRGQWSDE